MSQQIDVKRRRFVMALWFRLRIQNLQVSVHHSERRQRCLLLFLPLCSLITKM